jgi:CheY-like chemotaxis protein
MPSAPAFILLVDDDPDFIEINRAILEAQGYRVACAGEPDEALEKMETEKPDLVVSDLMMSRLDSGFSLAQRIKRDPRFGAIPVILVTAVSSHFSLDFRPRTPEDLAAMHADGYFDKPVAAQALVAKIEELLERTRPRDKR